MKIKDMLRTLVGIRTERQLPPPGELPPIGSNIVREKLRVRLKYPVSFEQWEWLQQQGWRTVALRDNRRRYVTVPDKFLLKLVKASRAERDLMHAKLIKVSKRRVETLAHAEAEAGK